MRISIRLYRKEDADIMRFLYAPEKKTKFDTYLVKEILMDYVSGSHRIYPVRFQGSADNFPQSKLLTLTIEDNGKIAETLHCVKDGATNIFIKSLIRKYTGMDSLSMFFDKNMSVSDDDMKIVPTKSMPDMFNMKTAVHNNGIDSTVLSNTQAIDAKTPVTTEIDSDAEEALVVPESDNTDRIETEWQTSEMTNNSFAASKKDENSSKSSEEDVDFFDDMDSLFQMY